MVKPLVDAQKAQGLQSAEEGATIDEAAPAQLDDEEAHAVLAYKSSESYTLNEALRDGGELTPEQRQMVERLDRALPKLRAYQGQVYRRIGFDSIGGQAALEAFLAEHKPGADIRYPAFTSASSDPNGYPVEGDLTVTLVIESQSGRDLDGHGNNMEREVVFPRGGRFFVERVETGTDGKPVIYMMEATDDGIGQLHSEKQHGDVQEVQEIPGEVHLRGVPEMDPGQSDGREMPGLRAEGDGGSAGVGAAARGFQVPGGESREERTSRYLERMGYNQNQAEATGLDRERYESRFRYRVQSEAESSQRAYEMLFFRDGDSGERFIKDVDPEGYWQIVRELTDARAWDAAQYILSELRRRAVYGEGTQEEYAAWQELVQEKGRETGRGVQANAKWTRSDNVGGRATENEAWEALQARTDLTEGERATKFSAVVKFDSRIETAQNAEALREVILDIARERVSRMASSLDRPIS